MSKVQITPQNIKAFEKAYNECEEDIFDFKGQPVLKSYAKYVLAYFSVKRALWLQPNGGERNE